MKHCLYIVFFLIISISILQAQQNAGDGKRFSLSNLSKANEEIPDSLLIPDSSSLDNKRLKAYRLTPLLGEPYLAPLDTHKLNFANYFLHSKNRGR